MSIKSLYYITHKNNVPSILDRGILSRERIEAEGVECASMFKRKTDARKDIRQRCKITPKNDGKTLLHYANLFFQPRNPRMYRAILEIGKENLAVVEVENTVLKGQGVLIADGNAADELTQFYPPHPGLKKLQQQWKVIQNGWWKRCDGSKRKTMAECLVPTCVGSEYIRSVIVCDDGTQNWVDNMEVESHQIPVVHQPDMFFQPNRRIQIGQNILLVDGGDLFFSEQQTLGITVNLQGVMGKGIALRARYQFSDVYVEYEKACRAKKIAAGKPYIYKREESVTDELADLEPYRNTIRNSVKWFLLFATKRHWRTNSRIEDIEEGLRWIQANFKKEEIHSLAMPALGCALGGLNWADVAPLMCQYLDIGIPVEIYLPREYPIEPLHLTEAYLLAPKHA